ncbi:polyisoprenoid-binding protein [bacterium]|nr:polyisoprenoid-binding protein [bacterium]
MKKMNALIVALLLSASSVFAQTKWEVDQVHTNVIFNVSHMVVAEVTGNFTDFNATITASKADYSDAQAEMTIKVASISTDNEKRDGHLKSEDFFAAEKYPEITFKSKSFKKTGDNTYKITGDFTMRGVTKTIELDAKFKGEITDPWGNVKSGWKVTGSVDRTEYGVNWNKAIEAGGFVVGKTVDITINAEFAKKK